ncbi:MAG: hypothetical protein E7350_00690 [Clostridiales bacterium]|nr:hypothetical protein [Clostridiales bacterium]
MARRKNLPQKVVDYHKLDEKMMSLYDEITASFEKKNIIALRKEALEMGVESPTTLNKKDLIRRMVDRVISGYLPPESEDNGIIIPSYKRMRDGGERINGLFQDNDGELRIGNCIVPSTVAKGSALRDGDLVEGIVTLVDGAETLVVVNSIDGESAQQPRPCFAEMRMNKRGEFGSMILGTPFEKYFEGLEFGERVIFGDMKLSTACEMVRSYANAIGLYVGVSPEFECKEQSGFAVSFDCPKREAISIARLALERAKRLCERGKEVMLVVYGLEFIDDRDIQHAIFGAGRSLDKGSITVIADVREEAESGAYQRVATRVASELDADEIKF